MIYRIFLSMILISSLVSCDKPVGAYLNTYTFETIEIGGYSNILTSKEVIITKASDFQDLWENDFQNHPEDMPTIDFDDEIVVAVFMGERANGGYSIAVTEIEEYEQALIINIKNNDPEPGSINTQALTQPYHIIRFSSTNKDIKFE